MAERRMFAKTIIDSDVFLDMPLSTQALYFHLSMRADDDGFINNPKKIMRMIGAGQNELELLLSKRYLLAFDSGIVVIKHWRIHNYIQKDRYNETKYLDEKESLKIQDNRAYTECIQNGDTGKVRLELDKVSLEESSVEDANPKPVKHKHGEYKHVLLTDKQYDKLLEEWGEPTLNTMIKKLDEGVQLKGYKYNDFNLALRKWYNKDHPNKITPEKKEALDKEKENDRVYKMIKENDIYD